MSENIVTDSITKSYFQNGNPCRLCWNKNAEYDLKDKIPAALNVDISYHKLILYALGIQVDVHNDKYPNKLCVFCLDSLLKIHHFKSKCRNFNKKLKEIFDNGSQDDEGDADKVEIELKQELHNDFKVEREDNSDTQTSFELEAKVEEIKVPVKKKRKPASTLRDVENYFCFICYEDLYKKDKYWEHNKEVHGYDSQTSFRCYGCNKSFSTRCGRLVHEKHHCKLLKNGYKCLKCSKCFPCRRYLQIHIRNHKTNTADDIIFESHNCTHCNLTFTFKSQLTRHVKKEHEERQQTHVCDICGRGFTKRVYLVYHIKTHTGDKGYQCNVCDFRAIQKSTLTIHLRKHTGDKPYACSSCPYRCTTSANLLKHKRIVHEGQMNHQCHLCGKNYRYGESLKEHFSAVHSSEKRPCPECGLLFVQVRNLRKHLRTVHGTSLREIRASEGVN